MKQFTATVLVRLNPSVLDPAGEAAKAASKRLGIEGVSQLRIGKVIELNIEATSEDEARRKIEVLSDKLLANPVIEYWTYEVKSFDSNAIS